MLLKKADKLRQLCIYKNAKARFRKCQYLVVESKPKSYWGTQCMQNWQIPTLNWLAELQERTLTISIYYFILKGLLLFSEWNWDFPRVQQLNFYQYINPADAQLDKIAI